MNDDEIQYIILCIISVHLSPHRGELLVTKDDAKVVLSEMDMAQTVKNIPENVPILLLHGTDDELIPCEDAAAYKSARESIDVTIVDGARHAFRGKKQLKQLLTVCSDWIGEKLRERGLYTAKVV
jgi:alpha-beta hydrolase superfamily lysophospholipase